MEIFNVLWSRHDEEKNYVVGYLIYQEEWYFKYNKKNIKEAIKKGFRPFPELPVINKVYKSDSLFKTFDNRLESKYEDKLEIMQNQNNELLTDNILVLYKKKAIER